MTAYVTVTLLNTVRPEDYGLSSDCSAEEFENVIYSEINWHKDEIEDISKMSVNDIEIEVVDGEC